MQECNMSIDQLCSEWVRPWGLFSWLRVQKHFKREKVLDIVIKGQMRLVKLSITMMAITLSLKKRLNVFTCLRNDPVLIGHSSEDFSAKFELFLFSQLKPITIAFFLRVNRGNRKEHFTHLTILPCSFPSARLRLTSVAKVIWLNLSSSVKGVVLMFWTISTSELKLVSYQNKFC